MSNIGQVLSMLLVSVLTLFGISAASIWYLDSTFGVGVGGVVVVFLIGVLVTTVIWSLSSFNTNQTQRNAGEDITVFAEGMAKVKAGEYKVQQELTRLQRELTVIEAKKGLIDHKALTAQEMIVWKEEQKAAAEQLATAEDVPWWRDSRNLDIAQDVELE